MRKAALIFILLTGCRDRIFGTGGELRLGATRVEFPNAFVGQTKRAELEVINTSRSPRIARFTTQSPFSMTETATEIEIPGASTIGVPLAFIPQDIGRYEVPLNLEGDDGQQLQAQLIGVADPPLDCVPSSPCRTSMFDLATGSCLETAANEGLECSQSNACYAMATCVAGQCVGTARDCNDGDACTTDLCDAQRGCFHSPNTARCSAPPDACHVAACDPLIGCTFVPAPDGTYCGPSDCTTARVCINGGCETRSVAEGAACGEPSPCQARGRCVANVCVRPAATPLVADWTVWVPEGEGVLWDSVADETGNVYWREGSYAAGLPKRLVSVSPSGVRRWAKDVPNSEQISLMDGLVVIRNRDGYEARRQSDGELVWLRNMSTEAEFATTRATSRGVGGSVYVGYVRSDGGREVHSTVMSLNVFNGSTLWRRDLQDQAIDYQTMPADENGYIYLGTHNPPKNDVARYLSFSPSGAQRWQQINPHASPAATFGGRVYHWDHWLSETLDGGWVNEMDPMLATSGFPRLALGAISYVGTAYVDAGSCADAGTLVTSPVMMLTRVDPPTSRQQWSIPISHPVLGGGGIITNPVLTQTAGVLFSQSVDYCTRDYQPYVLREISAAGTQSFSCPLPQPESYYGEGLLIGGRWIVAVHSPDSGMEGVRAIAIPGFALPEHGWATAWGSPARDNHAR